MAGLPKSIIKKYGISKKAWAVYRGAKSRVRKAVKRKAYKPRKSNRSVVRHMAKRRKRSRSRSFLSFTTVFKFLKIGALVAPAAYAWLATSGSPQDKLTQVMARYTGFNMNDGTFNFNSLIAGWGPYLATSLIGVGIQKATGIIRRL